MVFVNRLLKIQFVEAAYDDISYSERTLNWNMIFNETSILYVHGKL